MAKKIPAWQQSPTAIPAATEDKPDPTAEDNTLTTDAPKSIESEVEATGAENGASNVVTEEELYSQAQRFLRDPQVASATRDTKLAFLQSKGVTQTLANNLLDRQGSDDSVSPSHSPAVVSAIASSPPPIVTYPEFLLHSPERPPLVTTSAILRTTYVAGGLAAGMLAVSKLLLEPMQEALTEARHDFLAHTLTQLNAVNEKMASSISVVPDSLTGKNDAGSDNKPSIGVISDSDDDPTELYHRDMGTQTSPPSSRRGSLSSTASESGDVLYTQESRLNSMISSLKGIEASAKSMSSEDEAANQLRQLTDYLNELRYANIYSSYRTATGSAFNGEKDDEVERVRADIRSIKGVFLSTRNFPRGGQR